MNFRLRFLLAVSMLVLFPISAFAQTAAPTCSIRATPSTIKFGGSFTLSWTSTNATGGAIIGIGNVAPTGSRNTIPTRTTTYAASFTGPGGSANCSATVTIASDNSAIIGGSNDVINEAPTSPATGGIPTLTGGEPTGGPTAPVTGGTPNLTGGEPTNSTSGSVAVTNTNTNGGASSIGGLVPCTGLNCQACNVAELIQRLINFLVGLSIPLAAAMFAWAGILYYTSGVGGEKNISRAKAIFRSSALGFLFIICAWLGVQTLLKAVLNPTYYQGWNTIQCVSSSSRPINKTITEWLSVLSPLNTSKQQVDSVPQSANSQVSGDFAALSSGPNGYTCKTGYALDTTGDAASCYNPTTDDVTDPIRNTGATAQSLACPTGFALDSSGDSPTCYNPATDEVIDPVNIPSTIAQTGTGDCSADTIASSAAAGGYDLSEAQAQTLSCLAVPESACGRNTSIPTTPQGQQTSARGMFQIVMGYSDKCHSLNLDVCTQAAQTAGYNVNNNLNCASAFSGGRPKAGMEYLAGACTAASLNIQCNASAAACLVQANNGKFTDWTADPRSSAQQACVNKYSQ